jgi:hypothetical protein
MGLRQDGEAGNLSPGDLQLGQATGPICSLDAELLFQRSDERSLLVAQGL